MKEAREDVHTVDEDKVMKRASVGDDDSTHLACDLAKSVQVGGELLVFVGTKCLGTLEKSVNGPAVEVEELPHLGVRDPPRAVGLNDKSLKGLARKLIRTCPKSLYERVGHGDFDCSSHTTRLARYAVACRFRMHHSSSRASLRQSPLNSLAAASASVGVGLLIKNRFH